MMVLQLNFRKLPLHTQAGDTIVEVVIAIAVIASILAGAFVVSNRSTQDIRDSQEHAEALQLLQGQVELLRTRVNQIANDTGHANPFCLVSTDTTIYAASNAVCTLQSRYQLSIADPDASGTYVLTSSWDSVTGAAAQVQLFYRIQPSN